MILAKIKVLFGNNFLYRSVDIKFNINVAENLILLSLVCKYTLKSNLQKENLGQL